MEPKDYIVSRIEGEYAYLRDLSGECKEDLFITLHLLPPETDVGVKLHYELFCYTVVKEMP